MHRARFVNPFDARYDGAVVTVTRRDVFSPPPDVPAVQETADDLRQLDKLVRARVDVDLEHSPRPAKRRKLSDGAAAPSVSFRLFAQSDTREISLLPKEHPARKRELPVEDTSHERKTRRERAQQCTVDPLAASHSLPSAKRRSPVKPGFFDYPPPQIRHQNFRGYSSHPCPSNDPLCRGIPNSTGHTRPTAPPSPCPAAPPPVSNVRVRA